ncbi:large ribosomal subunit protein mL52-like [Oscarella lobularis]|uniref:large ribosomal subunit protein mL52-like n=1 Tax=Oscarella lobularis TaxID=121494 RepID=UPI0033137CA8
MAHVLPRASIFRRFGTFPVALAGQKWRIEKGMARSGNEYGPLTDLPDWSYADGRPAPESKAKVIRKRRQEHLAERIKTLLDDEQQAV